MADDPKTTATDGDVRDFVAAVPDDRRRRDAELLVDLLGEATGEPPVLWGTSIVGFGTRHYRYPSGREGDTAAVGFSPRAGRTVLYLTGGIEEYADLLAALGPHRTGTACLYLPRVEEVDRTVLREIAVRSHRAAAAG